MFRENIEQKEVTHLPMKIDVNSNYIILQKNVNNYTHGIFKYPCKFIPEIPRWAIKKYGVSGGIVFDPFAGSGTTLLEAQIQNMNAYGTEIDEIAKKIIKVKTQNYNIKDLKAIMNDFQFIMESYNSEKQIFVPDINNLNHWFPVKNSIALGRLKTVINMLLNSKSKLFFEVVFLSIIKDVSYADSASPKPYVSNKIKKEPKNVIECFKKTYLKYLKYIEEYVEEKIDNKVDLVDGDALLTIKEFKADVAITSPPYINAFDYPRTLRLENLWLGVHTEKSLLDTKGNYVGTERFNLNREKQKKSSIFSKSCTLKNIFDKLIKKDEKRAYIVKKFFEDMESNLKNVNNHLKEEGHYIIVIGNSLIRGINVESWKIINEIAKENGFEYVEHFSYKIQNPYIRIPRNGKGGRIKLDYVLVLQKKENHKWDEQKD